QDLDGLTVVLSTRWPHDAESADKVVLLDSGRQVGFGSPRELVATIGTDSVMVEGSSADSIERTLRGLFDIEIEQTRDGYRFIPLDGLSATAQILRHPPEGARAVYLKRPTLSDVLRKLISESGQPYGARSHTEQADEQ